MEQNIPMAGRAPVAALGDVDRFVRAAEHLKALALQRQALRARDSRRIASLSQQISAFVQHCGELAQGNPHVGELWGKTQTELQPLLSDVPPGLS